MKAFKAAAIVLGLTFAASGAARADALGDLLSKDKNPMVLFIYNMSEACPLDFIGLGKDLGEAAGLLDPYAKYNSMPSSTFGEQVSRSHEKQRAERSFWKKVMNRSCLLSKLFGDGSCARGH
jgi:hypothetical protein